MTDTATASLILRDLSLADGRRVDVSLRDGLIEAVEPADGPSHPPGPASNDNSLDLSGYLLLPAPVEPHAHLDKAYSADAATNPTGDLGGAVEAWLRYRPSMTPSDIAIRAHTAIRSYVAHGATAIRTHVDIGDDIGLRALTAVAAAREAAAGQCDLQLVAFAGSPLSGAAGAGHRALLRAALSAGADVVGACPGLDPDPGACIDLCLSTAADQRAPVDLHIDESLEPEPCTLALLADAVTRTEFPYRVVASHCVSLGMMAPEKTHDIADRVAGAGIAVICLPQTNLYLQARDRPVAPPRGITALRALHAAGVTVAAGGDNLQDPFNCLGRADPLDTAGLLVLVGHETPASAYAAVSANARRALGLPAVQVKVGAPAELLAVQATSVRQAIAESTPQRVVIHSGRVVARTSLTQEFGWTESLPSQSRRSI
jgi:cytosine/creatinine deaminase